ncbi:MAG TPA: hypothetical protein VMD98_11730 [Bryocella sp.]|nr:hypothetical protein [Bryocella sp.]
MYRKLMLAIVLFAAAAWLQAQAGSPQSSSKTAGAMPQHASVEGCLGGSNGNYTLTAESGTVYQLMGDTSQLREHVGHEVRISGAIPESGATSNPSPATPGASQQTIFDVQSVRHISGTCKSMAN